MTTFGKPCPAQGLQSLADGACSTGVVDRGSWLRIAQQCLSCALVRGRGSVFRQYCQSIAKSAGKDFCDGEVTSARASKVAPLSSLFLCLCPFCSHELLLRYHRQGRKV